jgi:hypothetical protein
MFGTEIAVLMVAAALLAAGSLVHSLRSALPRIAGLRQAAQAGPDRGELRWTVREIVVTPLDGKVVPLRPVRAVSLPRPALPARLNEAA